MKRWYALRVRSRCEKKVAEAGRKKGYEEFLPLCGSHRRWSDRLKWVELPLFPGYVFFRIDWEDRLPILRIDGALHFVGGGEKPVPLADSEIRAIQDVTASRVAVGPYPFLEEGHRVRLRSGPLAGVEGLLVETDHGPHVAVSLHLLRLSMAFDIERRWLRPVSTMEAAAALR